MNSEAPRPEPSPSVELIEAAAAAWLSLRDRGMSATETAEFVRWLQQDPRHATVFDDLNRVWQDFDHLGAVPAPGAVNLAPEGDLLAPRFRPRAHPRQLWPALGVAAAAAILLLGAIFLHGPRHAAETAIGAFQKLDLPDGSVAQLNTDTAIDTTFTPTERRVRILRGEVHFTVTKDPARPFTVTIGQVAVRAVGTAFNVRQRGTEVEVLVTEGRVRLDRSTSGESLLAGSSPTAVPPLLVAGERATVQSASPAAPAPIVATVQKVSDPEVQRALAWQERRLEFDSVPLDEVVREFNRYNQRKLVIGDPHLAARRFSGTFRADGYEALARLLEKDFGVTVIRTGGEIVLRETR
jgi:transmembrane sensor